MSNENLPVLVVEDVNSKFDDVLRCIRDVLGEKIPYQRATHLNEAEDLVMEGKWCLLILDLSMDISANGSLDLHSGHATLGGLDVLERVALMKFDLPTILITGFDTFQDEDRFENEIMNLSDIGDLASSWLGRNYFGCIRYGGDGWSDKFKEKLYTWREL